MTPGPQPLFPDWFSRRDVDEHFCVVDGDAEVIVMPMISYHTTLRDLENSAQLFTGTRPVVFVYSLDNFDEPGRGWQVGSDWEEAVRTFALRADLLAGPQLPIDIPHARTVPLPYGPLVPFARRVSPTSLVTAQVDVYFAGAWYPAGGEVRAASLDSRDRRYRAHIVETLREELADRRLDIRRVHFWRHDGDKASIIRRHIDCLDRTRVALAPAGHASYTARHSDVLARGRVLLSEPVHRRVRLPDPLRWENGDLALIYDPAADDIVDVVRAGLADHVRLGELAESGWRYALEHLTSRGQTRRLADAVRKMLYEKGLRG